MAKTIFELCPKNLGWPLIYFARKVGPNQFFLGRWTICNLLVRFDVELRPETNKQTSRKADKPTNATNMAKGSVLGLENMG